MGPRCGFAPGRLLVQASKGDRNVFRSGVGQGGCLRLAKHIDFYHLVLDIILKMLSATRHCSQRAVNASSRRAACR